jgi:hypothetical protein
MLPTSDPHAYTDANEPTTPTQGCEWGDQRPTEDNSEETGVYDLHMYTDANAPTTPTQGCERDDTSNIPSPDIPALLCHEMPSHPAALPDQAARTRHPVAHAGMTTTSALDAEPQTPPPGSGPGAGVAGIEDNEDDNDGTQGCDNDGMEGCGWGDPTKDNGDDDDGTEGCGWGDPREGLADAGVTAATAPDVAPQTSTTGSGSGAGVDGTSDTVRDRKRKHDTAHFWEITEEEVRRFIHMLSVVNLVPYMRSTRPDCVDAVDLLLAREAAASSSRAHSAGVCWGIGYSRC